MTKEEIRREARQELSKKTMQLAEDVISEANRQGLEIDLIKHVLKRMAVHQVILADRATKISSWLIGLSVVMGLGALAQILSLLGQIMSGTGWFKFLTFLAKMLF